MWVDDREMRVRGCVTAGAGVFWGARRGRSVPERAEAAPGPTRLGGWTTGEMRERPEASA